MSNSNIPILTTESLQKNYQVGISSLPILKSINLKISEGEFVAIMGPSGCGKSTLMHLLGLLDTPTFGKILLRGHDLSKFSENDRATLRNREMGFVFQQFNLLPRFTALQNVTLPTLYRREFSETDVLGDSYFEQLGKDFEKRGRELLAKVGLSSRINHKPNQLSGGEQQRVAIARSLINNPSIILADEPTGNLDTKAGQAILELLRGLNEEGKTVIIVTHDPNIASVCDRTIRLLDGEVVN